MTIFEEKEGVGSMRRTLAFILALIGADCLNLAIIYKTMIGVYAGTIALVGMGWLLGLTTWHEIKALALGLKKKDN